MTFRNEWEEPVPQPDPPKRSVRLLCERSAARRSTTEEVAFEPPCRETATLSDVAVALGVSLADVTALAEHGSISAVQRHRERDCKTNVGSIGGSALQALQGQGQQLYPGGLGQR